MATSVETAKSDVGSEGKTSAVAAIPFQFTGKASEYFKIWIVNILLTILTLGIYSAWAKVRRKRYFYGNTRLQNSTFEYLAEPVQILKGRLIAFGIFVVYAVLASFVPLVEALFGLLFIIVLPWLVIKAHAFNARYSSYRNIRFDFRANYGEAIRVYIGLPLLSVLTLGLAYPYYTYRRSKFLIANSGYGRTRFTFAGPVKQFYAVYLKAALLAIAFFLLFGMIANSLRWAPPISSEAASAGLSPLLFIMLAPLVLLAIHAYLETAITNLVWNNAKSGDHRFRSTLETFRMAWLYLSNGIAIVLSIGLLIPWAQVRMTRYRLENLQLLAVGDLDGFIASEQQRVASAGEEISEFFDIDIGL
ncbi:MAG: YjgN family protein [Acidiferrobacterales bacterium]